jgi:hypothetical protein
VSSPPPGDVVLPSIAVRLAAAVGMPMTRAGRAGTPRVVVKSFVRIEEEIGKKKQ